MKPASKKNPPTAVEPLIPQRLAYIFEHRPVLWFEDEAAYDASLNNHLAEYAPESILDFHTIKELTDTQWEIMRLHRISRAALDAEMPNVIVRELGSGYWIKKEELGVLGHEEELREYSLQATRGLEFGKTLMDDLIEAVDASYDVLLSRTFVSSLMTTSTIQERLAWAERRRDDIIKKYYERRRALSVMKRSLIEDKHAAGVTEVSTAEPIPERRPAK